MRQILQISLLAVCLMTLSHKAHCQKSRMVKGIIDIIGFVIEYGDEIFQPAEDAETQVCHFKLPKITLPTIKPVDYTLPKNHKSSLYTIQYRYQLPAYQSPKQLVVLISNKSQRAYPNIPIKTDLNELIAKRRYQQWGHHIHAVYIALPNLVIMGECGRSNLQ